MGEYKRGVPMQSCLDWQGKEPSCQGCLIQKHGYCKEHREILRKNFKRIAGNNNEVYDIFQYLYEDVTCTLLMLDDFEKGIKKTCKYILMRSSSSGKSPYNTKTSSCPGDPEKCTSYSNDSCLVARDGFCRLLCGYEQNFSELARNMIQATDDKRYHEMWPKLRGKIVREYNSYKRKGIKKYQAFATDRLQKINIKLIKKRPRTARTLTEWIPEPPEGLADFCEQHAQYLSWDEDTRILSVHQKINKKFVEKTKNLAPSSKWKNDIDKLGRMSRKPVLAFSPTKTADDDAGEEHKLELIEAGDVSSDTLAERKHSIEKEVCQADLQKKSMELLLELIKKPDGSKNFIQECARLFLQLYKCFQTDSDKPNSDAAKALGYADRTFQEKKRKCRKMMQRRLMQGGLA